MSLIIFSSVVDFVLGQLIELAHEKALLKPSYSSGDSKSPDEYEGFKAKHFLYLSLIVNLGLLGFFKYYDFFITEFIAAFGGLGVELHASTLRIILPVGISFYTFQTLSYTIDVYRKKLPAVYDWTVFFAYVSFFPQLVAGPIERATQLIPQFKKKRYFDYEQAKDGMRQILWGLFKKAVIADNCAQIVDRVFNNFETQDTGMLALGAVLFAFQIYCDFSGYSDIAIGTARLFGFKLMQNFSYPYFARDIAEFWRSWHISLSTWFRDYVYIPIGGSRVDSKAKLIRNIFVIFLVSGFWHGANWTFVAWGFLHALYFLPSILRGENRKNLDVIAENRALPSLKEFAQMLFTFALVCIAWIFFRAESISDAFDYLTRMATDLNFSPRPFRKNIFLFLGIAILLLVEWMQRRKAHGFEFDELKLPQMARTTIYLVTALAILLFSVSGGNGFIYFQF